jgi:hypothetical protein
MSLTIDLNECVSKVLPALVERLEELRPEVEDLWRGAEDLRYRPALELIHKIHMQVSGNLKAIAITKVSAVISRHLNVCFKRGIGNKVKGVVSKYIESWLDNKISTEEFIILVLKDPTLRLSSMSPRRA